MAAMALCSLALYASVFKLALIGKWTTYSVYGLQVCLLLAMMHMMLQQGPPLCGMYIFSYNTWFHIPLVMLQKLQHSCSRLL